MLSLSVIVKVALIKLEYLFIFEVMVWRVTNIPIYLFIISEVPICLSLIYHTC